MNEDKDVKIVEDIAEEVEQIEENVGLNGSLEYANTLAKRLEEDLENFDTRMQSALKPLLNRYLYRHKD